MAGSPGYSAPANVHAAVYAWSDGHPGENVPVVIQTSSDTSAIAAEITAAGGEVTQELGLVSAVQAEVPRSSLGDVAVLNGVSWVSLDAPIVSTSSVVDPNKVISAYPFAVKADRAWNDGYGGRGVGVAVVDTGISPTNGADFSTSSGASRVVAQVEVSSTGTTLTDGYGHGTHVAGIVGGNSDPYQNQGQYVGIAPRVNLVNVKIADDTGASSLGDLIAGLQWVNVNKATYNIRVVNLSLHSSAAESYLTSPLDAAVEALWFNGIFVVVAAGNTGSVADAVQYPPANDPFVMTVGAVHDKGTKGRGDDVPATWSSVGVTQDGFAKPEVWAPGVNIVSTAEPNSILFQQNPGKVVDDKYLKLSGTSMSAGVASGVAALILEKQPTWTPDQLKCTLINTAHRLASDNNVRMLDVEAMLDSSVSTSCPARPRPSYFLNVLPIVAFFGSVAWVLDQPDVQAAASLVGIDLIAANVVPDPALVSQCASATNTAVTVNLCNVDWSAIKWDAITWDAIKWDSIKWDAIKWDAIKWDAIKWDAITWDAIKWDAIKWDAIKWDAIKWDAIKWDSIKWDAIKWSSIKWDAIKWSSINFDAIKWSSVDFNAIKWSAVTFDAFAD